MKKQKFQPKFLVNEGGKTVAVQLDIKAYEAMLEELEDAYDVKRAEKIMSKKNKTHTIDEIERSFLGKRK
ncbi:MAG: hypothetical protein US49_C0005G0006 [candidate division TM6 bacterium GW2011_GWF2_37_49]|nr:MAG: hypothetical protein US49_C0005G0006 [candidate division TM6 bacterium GW2011_GWF2_37_49]